MDLSFLNQITANTWAVTAAIAFLAIVILIAVFKPKRAILGGESARGFWAKFWDFIADYGLNLLSILGAGAAVVANAFNPSLNIAIPAIFTLLAIVVYDQVIRDQRYNKPFQAALNRLLAESEGNTCLDDAYVEQIPFEIELRNAVTVEIVANTMARTLTSHSGAFSAFLQRGGTLRSVMMNSGGEQAALKMAAARIHDTVENFRTKVQLSLNQLGSLRAKATNGAVEVRLCDIAPSFGIYIFNRGRSDAKAYVRLFAHYIELDRNPTIEVAKSREPKLFEVFSEQFELIWKNATPTDIAASDRSQPQTGSVS